MRVYEIPETIGFIDDGEKFILKITKDLIIKIKDSDEQRLLQLGRKRRTGNPNSRPKPIIVRFISF